GISFVAMRPTLQHSRRIRLPFGRGAALARAQALFLNGIKLIGATGKHFWFSETVSSPKFERIENISLFQKAKSVAHLLPSRPGKRAYHDRHERGTGSGGRGGADNERRVTRTAKSCGPD